MRIAGRIAGRLIVGRTLYVSLTLASLATVALVGRAISPAAVRSVAASHTADEASSSTDISRDKAPLLREGTAELDLVGQFKSSGERVVFHTSDGTRQFGVLENLGLQRVTEVIRDNPVPLEWVVSGTVTEYRGANYLLLDRVVLKSTARGRH